MESAAEVGVIFEVMNDRGKPLSELDKVKNYLMYVGGKLVDYDHHELDEQINDAWAVLFHELMAAGLSSTQNEDQLLRAHWLMAYDPQPRKWSGARSVKERLRLAKDGSANEALLGDLVQYAKSLSHSSFPYADVQRPARVGSFGSYPEGPLRNEIVRWGDRLARLNVVAPFTPLLMAIRHRSPHDGSEMLEFLKLAEAFAFRVYAVLRRRADVGQVELFRLANDVYHGRVELDAALLRLRALLVHLCPTDYFEQEMRLPSNWYEWGPLVYFLYEYERHLLAGQGAEPDLSWTQLRRLDRKETIEHILPQTPSDPYWTDQFAATDIDALTHSLGNLMLTKDNSSYGNKPYPDKRGEPGAPCTCYRNGVFRMERRVAAEFDDWTPDSVRRRSEELIVWALERWRVHEADIVETARAELVIDEAFDDPAEPVEDETASALPIAQAEGA